MNGTPQNSGFDAGSARGGNTTPERWQQVKAVLSQALELDAAPRRSFLDSACAGDAELRAEVEQLLDHQVDTGADSIERCASDAAVRLRLDEVATKEGARIGPYKILRELGRGGMGAVYLAERDDEHYHQ